METALPKPEKLDAQLEKLQSELAGAKDGLARLKKQKKQLDVIRQNFESVLKSQNLFPDEKREPEQTQDFPNPSTGQANDGREK